MPRPYHSLGQRMFHVHFLGRFFWVSGKKNVPDLCFLAGWKFWPVPTQHIDRVGLDWVFCGRVGLGSSGGAAHDHVY